MQCSGLRTSPFKGPAERAQRHRTCTLGRQGTPPNPAHLVWLYISLRQAEHPSPMTDGGTVPPPAWELLESRSPPAFPVKPREGLNKHLLDP